jgi:hypothetical protein
MKPKQSPHPWRRRALWLGTAFIVYSLAGFLLAPLIIRSQLLNRLPSLTHRDVAVHQVRVNPWTLSLTVRGLSLTEPDGRVFASWESFHVNFQSSSLFHWAWTFKEILLENPFGEIILFEDGRFNFANLLERPAPDPTPDDSPGGILRLRIATLTVTNGFVALEDRTRPDPFRTEYRPINVRLTGFTTKPDTAAPYSFSADNDSGKTLSWAGSLTVEPLHSRGTVDLRGADLKTYQPYLQDFTKAQIIGGTLDLQFNYDFTADTNGLDLTLLDLALSVTELEVHDPNTAQPVCTIPDFHLEQGALDLRDRSARAGLIRVSRPGFITRIHADGSVNLLQLLVPSPRTEPPSTQAVQPSTESPWTLSVDVFQLEHGALTFDDQSRPSPFHTLLEPVTLTIKDFTTRPDHDAVYSFSFITESAEQLAGNGTLSVNPPQSTGQLTLNSLAVPKYQPYLELFLRAQVRQGIVDARVDYWTTPGPDTTQASVSNAVLHLANLQLQIPETPEPVISIEDFTVNGVEGNLAERSARVEQITLTRASILARRDANSVINLLGLLQQTQDPAPHPPAHSPSSNGKDTTATPWHVLIDRITLADCTVDWLDALSPQPASIQLDQIGLDLQGLSTTPGSTVAANLNLRVNQQGTLTLRGSGTLAPPNADVELEVADFDLRPLQPYVQQTVQLDLLGGTFASTGRLQYQPANTSQPALQFTGSMNLRELVSTDLLASDPLVKWDSLNVTGISLGLQPNHLELEEVRWDALETSLIIRSDQQLNFLTLFPQPNNATSPASAPREPVAQPTAPATFPLRLSTLALENASFRFEDRSVQPACQFGIQQLNGTILGLSTEPGATAELNFQGQADDQSPFAIFGTIEPFAQDAVLSLTFSNQNLHLTPFTPYVEKFTGYPLNSGRLSATLQYEIQQQALNAQNVFQIDQLTLGSRVESPDATSLPVKLAVALLKDRNGRIDLDVPVTGRLDDPEFRVAPIIFKTIANLITRAATSPFRLLGGLAGGGEELSFLEFAPGSAELLPGEIDKLDKLRIALYERPAVNLEIESLVDPQLDRDAIALQIVRQDIAALRAEELAASGQPASPTESADLDPVDYERLLRATVADRFGTNLTETLESFAAAQADKNNAVPKPQSADARPHLPERPGFFQRLFGWLPFTPKNSPKAIARRQARADLALLKQNPALATTTAAQLEALLASNVEVPPNRYRELMLERSASVQQALLDADRVSPERLFLVPPKAVDDAYRGEARVNLSLN